MGAGPVAIDDGEVNGPLCIFGDFNQSAIGTKGLSVNPGTPHFTIPAAVTEFTADQKESFFHGFPSIK
jgi:hypothetical protein